MKQGRFCAVLRHAVMMTGRTIKSYALLSVTIVLSFSLLLGYLTFTDTALYNRYKDLFSKNRGIGSAYVYNASISTAESLVEKAKEIGNTSAMSWMRTFGDVHLQDETGNWAWPVDGVTVYCLPHACPSLYSAHYLYQIPVSWLDGQERETITLEAGEMLMDATLFAALRLDQQEEPHYRLSLENGETLLLRVVGTVGTLGTFRYDEDGGILLDCPLGCIMCISMEDYAPTAEEWRAGKIVLAEREIIFMTDSPEAVAKLVEEYSPYGVYGSWMYEMQNEAMDKIRTEKRTKALITCALLVLLGINLYSSFSNALNERKFEIGVKRAVGASSFAIVRQFFYESLLVMGANILASIGLVTGVFIGYKYYIEHTTDITKWYDTYVLYISPHSVGMFCVCAITLTVVFSLVFAYKSTQVEIVQYLKAE